MSRITQFYPLYKQSNQIVVNVSKLNWLLFCRCLSFKDLVQVGLYKTENNLIKWNNKTTDTVLVRTMCSIILFGNLRSLRTMIMSSK